jgi:branched-subunit amino acid aminotransferase/4-amino-4-deoxychorismate lyase
MARIVFLNSKFIPEEEAKLSVLTPGFLYGFGLFETMRAYNNKIVYLDAHLKRIKQSCALIKIKFPYSLEKLKAIIQKTILINGFRDAYVRLTLWQTNSGIDILVIVRRYQPYSLKKYKIGFRACISSFKQNENSFLSRLKTTNYLFYQLAYLEAKNKGFEEAVILNSRGYIVEASRANIFFVKNKTLFTPSLACGCLEGITRRVVLDLAKKYNIPSYEGNFTPSDLYEADEAFLTNSLIGIMPLGLIEKIKIGKGVSGYKLTQFLIKKYKSLLLGK